MTNKLYADCLKCYNFPVEPLLKGQALSHDSQFCLSRMDLYEIGYMY